MSLIILSRDTSNSLTVDVSLVHRGKEYPFTLPFVVDPAAERTFVVPFWQEELEKHFGGIEFGC